MGTLLPYLSPSHATSCDATSSSSCYILGCHDTTYYPSLAFACHILGCHDTLQHVRGPKRRTYRLLISLHINQVNTYLQSLQHVCGPKRRRKSGGKKLDVSKYNQTFFFDRILRLAPRDAEKNSKIVTSVPPIFFPIPAEKSRMQGGESREG